MKNLNLNILNSTLGFVTLNTNQIIPDELLDQIIKLVVAVLTAVLTNWIFKKKKE